MKQPLNSNNDKVYLALKTSEQAVNEALEQIEAERSGIQRGLFSRFPLLNLGLLKYWRFDTVTLIAAMSGAGKSYFLGMLKQDFTNPRINGRFDSKVIILHACYEMSASNEIVRILASDVEVSYAHVLTAEYDKDTKGYKGLNDEEYVRLKDEAEKMKKLPIYYIETAGSLEALGNTLDSVIEKFPKHKVVLMIDHTLLSRKTREMRDDLALVAATAQFCIDKKKKYNKNLMIIMLGQLNGNIERDERIQTPALHFPKKTDIHAQAQLYWACDNVMVLHRPELLGIRLYSSKKYHTAKLVHLYLLKSRFGNIGSIYLYEQLHKGVFQNIPSNLINGENPPLQQKSLFELMS